MDINCEYYKVFYYVAKYGNVSQAARYMTQSAESDKNDKKSGGPAGLSAFFKNKPRYAPDAGRRAAV